MAILPKNNKQKTSSDADVKLIYIGPNLKGGKLTKYTVFKGMPTHIDDVFEKLPEIRHLFVKISNMALAEQEVNTVGTPKNKYYKQALEV